MKCRKIAFLCLIIITFCRCLTQAQPVAATNINYYVSTTGNDNNPGTLSQPWLTFQHATNTAVAGDTVNFLAGTYSSNQVTITNSGSIGNYITFQNYNSATVIIVISDTQWIAVSTNGKDYLKFIGLRFAGANNRYDIDVYQSDYVIIQNCYFTSCKSSGIYSENSSHVAVDNCEVNATNTNAEEECISFVNTNHFEVKNCIIHDPGSSQRIGIDLKEGCSNGSVHNNTVYNLSGYYPSGIYVDSRGNSDNIQIYNNLIFGIPNGYGIELGDETADVTQGIISNINIYNNIVYGCANGFMMVEHGTGTHYTTFTNCYFINNTLYSNSQSIWNPEIWIDVTPATTTNCIIRNNIIYGTLNKTTPIYDPNHAYANGKLLVDHNLFYNSAGSFYNDTDNIFGSSYIIGNPLLVSPTTNFSISSGSPAIDTGYAISAPSTDYVGHARPQGSGYDLGAYEYINTSPAALVVTTNTLPNGTVGVNYSQTLEAIGGTQPYAWVIISGALPEGLKLSSNGVISGKPSAVAASFSITFQVSDGAGATASKTLSISTAYSEWDMNMDGLINVLDIIIISQHWGETGAFGWIRADVNHDGAINILDITVVGQHWTG